MKSGIAFPFLVLPDDVVEFGGWMLGPRDEPLKPAVPILENWDYAQDLQARASVSIDWPAAARGLELSPDTLQLKLSLIAGTGAGTLPRRQVCLSARTVDQNDDRIELSGILPGCRLSGRVHLVLQITLASPCGDVPLLSPSDAGARLWNTAYDVLIEDGGNSRFPVEAASFSKSFAGKNQQHAPWVLLWFPDSLQSDFAASVRLYVNADRADVLQQFEAGDPILLQSIMGDVLSQMLSTALDQDDIAEALEDCEPGSVGQQIQKWMAMAFPQQEVKGIRSLRRQNPGAFRAAILAAAEPGERNR